MAKGKPEEEIPRESIRNIAEFRKRFTGKGTPYVKLQVIESKIRDLEEEEDFLIEHLDEYFDRINAILKGKKVKHEIEVTRIFEYETPRQKIHFLEIRPLSPEVHAEQGLLNGHYIEIIKQGRDVSIKNIFYYDSKNVDDKIIKTAFESVLEELVRTRTHRTVPAKGHEIETTSKPKTAKT